MKLFTPLITVHEYLVCSFALFVGKHSCTPTLTIFVQNNPIVILYEGALSEGAIERTKRVLLEACHVVSAWQTEGKHTVES
jgi:hypothetical protein